MKILVLGGAGYIGSHTVRELLKYGYEVVVADNLQTGHRESIPDCVKFYEGDIRDKGFLDNLFEILLLFYLLDKLLCLLLLDLLY